MCPIRVLLISLLSGIVLIGSLVTFSEFKSGLRSSFAGKLLMYSSQIKSGLVYPTTFVSLKAVCIAVILIASHAYILDTDGILTRMCGSFTSSI